LRQSSFHFNTKLFLLENNIFDLCVRNISQVAREVRWEGGEGGEGGEDGDGGGGGGKDRSEGVERQNYRTI
jgi:hypothetical protein